MTTIRPLPSPVEALASAFTDFDEYLSKRAVLPGAATSAAPSIATGATAPVPTLGGSAADITEWYRPNGERYFPRIITIDGTTWRDVDFVTASYNDGLPVLLYGPPGTGKTAMFDAALPGLVTLQGNVETEVADFIGSWVQRPDGSYAWVDGPLIYAMENGLPFLIDEVAIIDPRVLTVVYGTMDGRGQLVVTANPDRGIIQAKPGFIIYGAFNPDVPGALVSDALLSRFMVHAEVGTDWTLAKTLGVPPTLIQVARNLNLKWKNGQVTAAPQLRELLTYLKVARTFGEAFALNNFVGQCHPEDRDVVIEAVAAVFGSRPETLSI